MKKLAVLGAVLLFASSCKATQTNVPHLDTVLSKADMASVFVPKPADPRCKKYGGKPSTNADYPKADFCQLPGPGWYMCYHPKDTKNSQDGVCQQVTKDCYDNLEVNDTVTCRTFPSYASYLKEHDVPTQQATTGSSVIRGGAFCPHPYQHGQSASGHAYTCTRYIDGKWRWKRNG